MATYSIDTSGFTPEQIALINNAGTLAAPGNTVTTYQSNPSAPVTPVSYQTASSNLAGANLSPDIASGAQSMLASAYNVPNPIPVSTLTSDQTALNVAQPSTTTPYPVSTLNATAPMTLTQPEQQAQQLTQQLQDLYNQDTGQSAYRAQQEQVQGIPALTQTYTDLSSQLTAIQNEAAAIPLQLQQGASDRGVTVPLLGAQENSRLRTNAIAALGVSTLLAAAQGKLAYAQTLVDKAVEQKYAPIEERIKALTANLQLNLQSPAYTLADKNRAMQQLQIQQQNQLNLEQQKTNTQQVWSVATTAASNGQNFKPTAQYTTLAMALKGISEASSPQVALQIAASVNLVQSQTSPTGGQVLGSASTGYFSYDPATGKTTPISSTSYSPTGTSGGTTSTSGGSTYSSTTSSGTSTYRFTSTQLNTGSAKAGLSLDAFKTLPGDVQNYFVNTSATTIQAINDFFAQVQSGSKSVDEVKQLISSSNSTQAVKDYWLAKLAQIKPTTTSSGGSFLGSIWNGITSFFGF